MGQLAIVNAPASFTFIWSVIKPWLSKDTVEKVDILGSDYQEVLLGLIGEENLPTSLGGGCECEGGCEYSFAGPWKEDLEERRKRRKRESNRRTERIPLVNGASIEENIHVPTAAPTKIWGVAVAEEH